MYIYTYSRMTAEALNRFFNVLANSSVPEYRVLYRRIIRCSCEVMCIGLDVPEPHVGSEWEAQWVSALHEAWRCIYQSDTCGSSRLQDVCRRLLQVSEPLLLDEDSVPGNQISVWARSRLLRLRECGRYVIFLKRNERLGLPPYHFDLLTSIYQLESGNLPVHAAGIIRNGGLMLFAGPSGAGKSTIAMLGRDQGYKILDEDQVLIRPLNKNEFTADAWGYDVRSCDALLRTIMFLTQSDEDRLVPLSQTQLAQLLFERHKDIMTSRLANQVLIRSLNVTAAIARTVPGYELHFRKSPEFWKLIDEQFPD